MSDPATAPQPDRVRGLPEGWSERPLSDVFDVNPGQTSRSDRSGDVLVAFVPMVAVDAASGTIAAPEVRRFREVVKGHTAFRDGDVIVAKITPCFENGKVAVARGLTGGIGFGSTEFHVLRPHGVALAEYVYHYLRQQTFRDTAAGEMTGTVGQRRLPVSYLRQVRLPIPPLAEQHRIVATIEALLGSMDAARERLANVPTILKRFRRAVLAGACSGRLTVEWRERHQDSGTGQGLLSAIKGDALSSRLRTTRANIVDLDPEPFELPPTWSWASVADVSLSVTDGDHQAPPKAPEGVPFVVIGNVSAGHLDFRDTAFVPQSYYDALRDDRRARVGDILFTVTGSYGICVLVETDRPFCFQRHIALVRPHREIASEFLRLALASPFVSQQAAQVATGIAQLTVPLSGLRALRVPVPPKQEQFAIVSCANALLALADAVERRVQNGTVVAKQAAQAILAKAFRGELVPREAEVARRDGREYESADILLARMRRARATGDPTTGGPHATADLVRGATRRRRHG